MDAAVVRRIVLQSQLQEAGSIAGDQSIPIPESAAGILMAGEQLGALPGEPVAASNVTVHISDPR